MTIGHPDFADVRRHSFGRTLTPFTGTLAIGGQASTTITEVDAGDLLMLSTRTDAGMSVLVASLAPGGIVAEQWSIGSLGNQLSSESLIVTPYGGGVSIQVWNVDGAAGASYTIGAASFIGTDQRAARIGHTKWTRVGISLGNGAASLPIIINTGDQFDRYDCVLNASNGPTQLQVAADDNGMPLFLGSSFVSYLWNVCTVGAGGGNAIGSWNQTGMGQRFYVLNQSGVNITATMTVRATKYA